MFMSNILRKAYYHIQRPCGQSQFLLYHQQGTLCVHSPFFQCVQCLIPSTDNRLALIVIRVQSSLTLSKLSWLPTKPSS